MNEPTRTNGTRRAGTHQVTLSRTAHLVHHYRRHPRYAPVIRAPSYRLLAEELGTIHRIDKSMCRRETALDETGTQDVPGADEDQADLWLLTFPPAQRVAFFAAFSTRESAEGAVLPYVRGPAGAGARLRAQQGIGVHGRARADRPTTRGSELGATAQPRRQQLHRNKGLER